MDNLDYSRGMMENESNLIKENIMSKETNKQKPIAKINMRRLKIIFPVLIVSMCVAALNVFSAEKHECSNCHVTADNNMRLKASLAELCNDCHSDRTRKNEHRVGMVPSMKAVDLPLSQDGRMTCITCHDPHEKSGYPMLLRVNPSELCTRCHVK
jgi:predicted CXXCH cytochrome family protein